MKLLVLNADDFGLDPAINAAVARAHAEGLLTSASLVIGATHAAEAVEIARQHPGLGVGIHLSPVAWNHYYTVLILPVTIGIAAASERNGTVSRAFLVGLALYFIGSVLGLTVPPLQARGILFLGTLALWLAFCIACACDYVTMPPTVAEKTKL